MAFSSKFSALSPWRAITFDASAESTGSSAEQPFSSAIAHFAAAPTAETSGELPPLPAALVEPAGIAASAFFASLVQPFVSSTSQAIKVLISNGLIPLRPRDNPPAPPTENPGQGNDGSILVGTNGEDTLQGTAGNDTIDGLGGSDSIDGGAGDDSLIGGDSLDEPWLDPIGPAEIINGGAGNDTMLGGAGSDGFILNGDYGTDVIDGGADTDLLFAGGSRAFLVDLAAGTATGGGSSGSATLVNVDGAAGGRFDDRLLGNDGDNLFRGGAGDDSINGRGGNDHLMSQLGNDTLTGGSGADEFRFDAPAGAADADAITDFVSGSDKIVLDGSFGSFHEEAVGDAFGDFAPGDERFHSAPGASAAQDDTDRVIYNTSTGQLYYDPDGTGTAPTLLMATLQGAPALAATDITVF